MDTRKIGNSIEYKVEANHNDPVGDDMPACAYHMIDDVTARRIIEWSDYVVAQGLGRIEKYGAEVHYYTDDDNDFEDRGESANKYLKVSDTVLVVDGQSFWYESRAERFDAELSTYQQSVNELAAEFGLVRGTWFEHGKRPRRHLFRGSHNLSERRPNPMRSRA